MPVLECGRLAREFGIDLSNISGTGAKRPDFKRRFTKLCETTFTLQVQAWQDWPLPPAPQY